MTVVVDLIHLAAQDLLDATVAALDLTDAGFTGISYLSPGQPAIDGQCDFAAAWMAGENLASGGLIPTSQQYRTGPRINIVTLQAQTGRCLLLSGRGGVPLDTERAINARKHLEDGQALWNHIGDQIAAGELFSVCSQVSLPGMTAYTPQGGFAGWTLTVQVQIDGH